MPNDFFAVIDLEKLADKLEQMGFARGSFDLPADPGRSSRPAANEPDDWPNEPPQDEDEADPWADDEPRQERRPQQRSSSRSGNSGGRSSGGQRSSGNRSSGNRSGGNSRGGSRGGNRGGNDFPSDGTHTDNFDREWTFGLPDAPECNHGHTAAMVEGTSQNGNDYTVWACPVGYGKNYKQKCDLWDYVS